RPPLSHTHVRKVRSTMSTDAIRLATLRKLEDVLGPDEARYLMEGRPPFDWHQLATKDDLAAFATKADLAQLRGEFAELRGEFNGLRGEFAELRGEFNGLRGEFNGLRGEFRGFEHQLGSLRNELRVEIHQSIRNQTWALVAWSTALAGIVLGVAR